MEIKKYFKNRNKFVDLSDEEEYNILLQKLNFVKGGEIPSNFLNESEVRRLWIDKSKDKKEDKKNE